MKKIATNLWCHSASILKKDETNLLETKEIIKQYLFEFEWFILLHNFFESYEGLMDFSKMLDTHTKDFFFKILKK